jgi:hypothetical protein
MSMIITEDLFNIDEGQGEQWLQADDFKVIASYQDGDIELSFTIDYDKGDTA